MVNSQSVADRQQSRGRPDALWSQVGGRARKSMQMIGTAPAQPEAHWVGMVSPGVSVPMDSIRTPGAYVCNWSGHLLRVPEQSLVPDGIINIVGSEPLFVTKISDDPDIPLGRARQMAAALRIKTSF